MRAPPAAVVLTLLPACSLLGFYDEQPTDCPGDIRCCSESDPLAHGGCDWTCNDPAAPDFRLAALRVEADQPVATLFRAALEGAVATGGVVWLVDLEPADGEVSYRVGDGTCDADGACAFGAPEPTAGRAILARDGPLLLPGDGTFESTVTVASPELGEPVPIALHECTLVGEVEAGGNCMGRRQSASPGDWSTPARLGCKISANEAAEIDLSEPNITLCDLLAGCGEIDCCDEPSGNWPNQPDTTVQGFPGWSLQADAAAIGVRIAD